MCVLVLLGSVLLWGTEAAEETTTFASTPLTTAVTENSSEGSPWNSHNACRVLYGNGYAWNGTDCVKCVDCCSFYPSCMGYCGCHWWLSDEDVKVVAQAVLGVAVVVTFLALVCLLWKTCSSRQRRSRLSRARDSTPDFLDDTSSLNSAQVFVVERLRDRPPRYDEAARDPAIEKPPAYHQVVNPASDDSTEPPPPYQQTVMVEGMPIVLVGANLTARNFLAPPSYTEHSATATVHQAVGQPVQPSTPPAQRLRRIVHKLVVMRRFGASDTPPPPLTAVSTAPKERRTTRGPIGVAEVVHHQHRENDGSNQQSSNTQQGVDNRAFTEDEGSNIQL